MTDGPRVTPTTTMVNERNGGRVVVQDSPIVIAVWMARGYVVDTDPPFRGRRNSIPWRFDPTMPIVPSVATRFRGRYS